MTLDQFATACDLTNLVETDRACHLAYFYLKTKGAEEFSASDAAAWLVAYGFPAPNRTRLDTKLKETRNTIRGKSGYKLSLAFVRELDGKYPALSQKSQDIVDDGTILPEIDYEKTRDTLRASLNKSMRPMNTISLTDARY